MSGFLELCINNLPPPRKPHIMAGNLDPCHNLQSRWILLFLSCIMMYWAGLCMKMITTLLRLDKWIKIWHHSNIAAQNLSNPIHIVKLDIRNVNK